MTGRAPSRRRLDIVGWSATSPFGTGRAAFSQGLREGRGTSAPLDHEQWQVPAGPACLVPDFDVRKVLGKKGTRSMNRVTGLAVSTVGDLLAELDRPGLTPETTGMVLGTTGGSVQSTLDFTRGSLTGELPYLVDPGLIPYGVMNGAAGQIAIWHQLKGPNATLAAGRSAGLLALNYARRLLLTDRAEMVLCGAAEEYSTARAWLARHTAESDPDALLLGEGCAMFALTAVAAESDPVAQATASLVGVKALTSSEGDWEAVVRRAVGQLLDDAGITPADLWAVSPSAAAGAAGKAEAVIAQDLVAAGGGVRLPVAELLGEAHAASAAFQLAAVLGRAEADERAAGRFSVVTSTDEAGTVAAALLRHY
ncbi:beta-ketoacyl synthase N-terminal-like domain-containing protein [Streptacidiphilus anmyonensis]|uniref:beta-ketoacyl synthase N-terminal-like domain-containing protein n=1 Tax=Streptacidiphilus anmyonensis TaxID=405782 RepID=UPI0005A8A543|nr:beta-ketoacyl synthase N-terminal-like domain-containing protein [Streptacidiphilus anmyonensis]